jgi:hypothetical protein
LLLIVKKHARKILIFTKIHSFFRGFSVYENKVLQLMSAGARLERFGEKDLVFIKRRSCRHCSKNEWTLVHPVYVRVFWGISLP